MSGKDFYNIINKSIIVGSILDIGYRGDDPKMDIEKQEVIRTQIEPKVGKIKVELDGILNSKTLEEGEKLHQKLSCLSVEDLLKPFTV